MLAKFYKESPPQVNPNDKHEYTANPPNKQTEVLLLPVNDPIVGNRTAVRSLITSMESNITKSLKSPPKTIILQNKTFEPA